MKEFKEKFSDMGLYFSIGTFDGCYHSINLNVQVCTLLLITVLVCFADLESQGNSKHSFFSSYFVFDICLCLSGDRNEASVIVWQDQF